MPPCPVSDPLEVLDYQQWEQRMHAHQQRVAELTHDHLERRTRGIKHPIFDFLFDYYPTTPGQLSRWHPGLGVALDANDRTPPHSAWRFYKQVEHETAGRIVMFDAQEMLQQRRVLVAFIHDLLTRDTPARFDCFGLHEWAMVYQGTPRHDMPLRLSEQATNEVVDTHSIRCSHYDAFRFFTEAARPLNAFQPTRGTQPVLEHPGCLHATMDLYKWATKLGPAVDGETWLETFRLARDVRILDMEASPYDCRPLGFGVVAIETPEGKAEYVARQRDFTRRAEVLRKRLSDCAAGVFGTFLKDS